MNFTEATSKLQKIGQTHVLQDWALLNESEKKLLLDQIETLDIPTFGMQQQLLSKTIQSDNAFLEPFTGFSKKGNVEDIRAGQRLISEGRVGCLLVAGGQGTRLRMDGPKGMFPVSIIKHKSLFQLIAEKVVAAGKQAGRLLQLAIMTSPINHEATVQFFRKHHLFGLQKDQVTFFSQGMLPFLDKEGNLVLENSSKIGCGPDGNGSSLQHFVEEGVWKKWSGLGVRYVNYILIDNALADPFDAELVGFHHRQSADVTVKCAEKRDTEEKVGLLIKQEKVARVVEYTEMPENERVATLPDGSLKHKCANLSLFCLNMDFIKAVHTYQMPLHAAYKATNGNDNRMVWKFEKFIFDIFSQAKKVAALLYPREACFAPLKNYRGLDSLEDVQRALQNQARRVFHDITGIQPPDVPFELSADFLYPTPELLAKWKNAPFPHTPYIEM